MNAPILIAAELRRIAQSIDDSPWAQREHRDLARSLRERDELDQPRVYRKPRDHPLFGVFLLAAAGHVEQWRGRDSVGRRFWPEYLTACGPLVELPSDFPLADLPGDYHEAALTADEQRIHKGHQ